MGNSQSNKESSTNLGNELNNIAVEIREKNMKLLIGKIRKHVINNEEELRDEAVKYDFQKCFAIRNAGIKKDINYGSIIKDYNYYGALQDLGLGVNKIYTIDNDIHTCVEWPYDYTK